MASIPPLRRLFLPAVGALLLLFFLYGAHSPLNTSFRQTEIWISVWKKPVSLLGNQDTNTSRLHYLIPASHPNLQLCYNLVSSAVNRYPTPTLLGWNASGQFNASMTHLAKLRNVKRYLHSLPARDDDDLVLIVDAYDIIHQLPAEVMLERYFEVADRADASLAARFNISVSEARKRNLRQTVFWGPDKVCFPLDPRAARCWAVPPSSLGPTAYGPRSGNGELDFNDPRWLNSGTVMGPVADMRRLIDATMDEITATYDETFELRDSDQYYVSNVWARQEYWRSKKLLQGAEVPGGPIDRILPDEKTGGNNSELHVAIEYESALFQTKAGNDPFLTRLAFGDENYTSIVKTDTLQLGDAFKPFSIKMPENVRSTLSRLYDSVPETHPGKTSSDWLRTINLGVNVVTKHIYALWHCTGPKDGLDAEYREQWWYPFAESLVKAAVKSSQSRDALSSRRIDGRLWAPMMIYPSDKVLGSNVLGGAWSDAGGNSFVPWSELCGPHEETLFQGERKSAAASPAPLSRRSATARRRLH
ncbi:hypothetical protein HIM_03241 [Hirsutella minnesotensis 3608]|nr:hypothetical protein HIM_03241 [Hirsutella minnesotensis 3608]